MESVAEHFQRLAKEQGVRTEFNPTTNTLIVFGTIVLPTSANQQARYKALNRSCNKPRSFLQ